ncbi:MAG: D-tyrosyl-tRNA(Tyr) deacylase [Clostridiales bacterium]|nr:D-tyrosyl-tRNA(Tyr) deacylase [Clostridiales bacterium]
MRLVIQRVSEASVSVDGKTVGRCGEGFLVLVGVEAGDGESDVRYAAEKTIGLRVFEDDAGKMNRSIQDVGGSILAISQFTLLGDARHGRRPSFSDAARPEVSVPLYEMYCQLLREAGIATETGIFGADMRVSLVNDGPVTILLDSRRRF